MNSLWKSRNPTERTVSLLSKLINVIKDVMKLSEEHNIESKLYYGEGINRIYGILGDDKLTKWLAYISDRNFSDKGLWEQLVIFLERDLKVHQQKLLLQNKFDETQQDRKDDDHKRYQVRSASHYSGQDHDGVCSFCDARGHVVTNGH